MKVEITMLDDGRMVLGVAEGNFAEAKAALERLRALAEAAGLPIEFEDRVEQHRHEHTPDLEVRT